MMSAPRAHGNWVLWAAGLAVSALLLGMAQAWSNMERMDLAYEYGRQQSMLAEKTALADKLEVARDSLLAAHRLRSEAETMHLSPAGTGRIRVIERKGDGAQGGQGS